jgi:hypothetical protein
MSRSPNASRPAFARNPRDRWQSFAAIELWDSSWSRTEQRPRRRAPELLTGAALHPNTLPCPCEFERCYRGIASSQNRNAERESGPTRAFPVISNSSRTTCSGQTCLQDSCPAVPGPQSACPGRYSSRNALHRRSRRLCRRSRFPSSPCRSRGPCRGSQSCPYTSAAVLERRAPDRSTPNLDSLPPERRRSIEPARRMSPDGAFRGCCTATGRWCPKLGPSPTTRGANPRRRHSSPYHSS